MKLTAQEVIKMKSVNIGAVSADMLPDVGDMAFDNSQSRKQRMSSFLRRRQSLLLLRGRWGVKNRVLPKMVPFLQDALCAFLLRQRSGL